MKRPTNRYALLVVQDLAQLALATDGETQWAYNLEVGQ